ncbi:glycosyltransferase family 2 protein [Microbacterium sp.]|uniref:glycosyltransferase family 2 protein n=1 Tax=Microbacterium sp. TaxID=51671 RepID=UPI0037C75B4D
MSYATCSGEVTGEITPVGNGDARVQGRDHVAVVIPAFNEAEGLPTFLAEIRASFEACATSVTLIVVDDASTDGTGASAADLADVVRAPTNRGHGPSALAAYAEGLRSGADAIVHVDGDGQFLGDDIARVAAALNGADVVHGVRRGRTDPWFRRTLSALVGFAALMLCGRPVPDVNTPLRAYRPDALRRLMSGVPDNALVPHVHFSIAEARWRFRVRYIAVTSIPRRGANAQGTMWGSGRARLVFPPRQLLRFARRAFAELWHVDIARSRRRAGRPDRRTAALRG